MKIENFEVLTVDGDGTVQLLNLDMVDRGVHHAAVWCFTDEDFEEGQIVRGGFDFDPGDSLIGGFPTFTRVQDEKP
jgi:hypothetical protein